MRSGGAGVGELAGDEWGGGIVGEADGAGGESGEVGAVVGEEFKAGVAVAGDYAGGGAVDGVGSVGVLGFCGAGGDGGVVAGELVAGAGIHVGLAELAEHVAEDFGDGGGGSGGDYVGADAGLVVALEKDHVEAGAHVHDGDGGGDAVGVGGFAGVGGEGGGIGEVEVHLFTVVGGGAECARVMLARLPGGEQGQGACEGQDTCKEQGKTGTHGGIVAQEG